MVEEVMVVEGKGLGVVVVVVVVVVEGKGKGLLSTQSVMKTCHIPFP